MGRKDMLNNELSAQRIYKEVFFLMHDRKSLNWMLILGWGMCKEKKKAFSLI